MDQKSLAQLMSRGILAFIFMYYIAQYKFLADEIWFYDQGDKIMNLYDKGEKEEAVALLEEGDREYRISKIARILTLSSDDCYKYINKSNNVKGRIALENDDVELAKSYLLKASNIERSSAFAGFGPNMSLAKELLEVGERDIVFEYFDNCKLFWAYGTEKMEAWKVEIKNGEVPDFGGNMVY